MHKNPPETQEMALKRLYFSKFSWGAWLRTPLEVLAPSARVGQIRVRYEHVIDLAGRMPPKNSSEAKILANSEITGDQCTIVYYQLLLQQKEIEIFRSTIAKMTCILRKNTKDYIYNYISPVFSMLGKLFLLGSNVYIVAYTRKNYMQWRTHVKISQLLASLQTSCPPVVFARLVASCQRVWNKLLTTCNNLAC